jgi:hypothetical protein
MDVSEERAATIYVVEVMHATPSFEKAANEPFKDEAQTALFKDPVRTAL